MLWYRKETPFLATTIDGRVSVQAGVSGGRLESKSMRRAPKQRLDVVYDAYAQANGAIPG